MIPFHFGFTGFWMIIMMITLVVEAVVPGLVSIWFALGALVAMVCASLHAPVWAQILAFVVVSLAALLATRPLASKYVNAKVQATNADRIIGKECIVREEIDNLHETGAISVDGKLWTARCTDDSLVIPSGMIAVVEKIEGVKAIVTPISKEE